MRKLFLSVSLIALAAVSALSQQPTVEQGKPAELKGVTKVYLMASNSDARRSILGEIKRNLPNLTFTDRREDAEVWLIFNVVRGNVSNADPASSLLETRVPISPKYETIATGTVLKPIAGNHALQLTDFKDSTEGNVAGRLGSNFAKKFIRLYRKANSK